MNDKILLIGCMDMSIGKSIAASIGYHDVEIISPEQAKETGSGLLIEPEPYLISRVPVPDIHCLEYYPEKPNFITGKKLPRKNKKR